MPPLTIELTSDKETLLRAKADARGMSLAEYLVSLAVADTTILALEDVIALYQSRRITQGQGAALAALSRVEFLAKLSAAHVTPFQYDSADELLAEAADYQTCKGSAHG